jgi:hypothetical protein
MAPTSIFFNGRLISIPGSYSKVDASGLESVGLTASGIVACVGEAVGGTPWSAIPEVDVKDNLQVATNSQQPFEFFREGDLKEAAPILFGPANDEDVQAGAQEIVFVKTNPSAKSSSTFSNGDGDALTLTSKDYGYFTRQINVEIANGTNKGKLVTIVLEDVTEALDDLGGDAMFKLKYAATTPANGYATITLAVSTSALTAAFTLAKAGLDSDITNPVAPGAAFELVSSDAGDAQTVTVYGTDATNAAQQEALTVNGLSVVTSTKTWNAIHGARISAAPTGTVTIRNLSGGTTITTLTAGALTKGLHTMSDVSAAGVVLNFAADGASTAKLTVVGVSYLGAALIETVTLNGPTPVATTGKFSTVTYLAFGAVAAARTVTMSANAVYVPATGQPTPTIQRAADIFNATPGFTFTIQTGETALALSNMDVASATDIKSPLEPSFYATLYQIVSGINAQSDLVVATRATPGTGAPTNTTAPVFLSGGHEGSTTPGQEGIPTSTNADWTGALNLLKSVRVNSVVLLTHDPAVHALGKAHVDYMCGAGRSERDLFVGVRNAALTGLATKTEVKAHVVNLNDKYVRVWAQNIGRYNTEGEGDVEVMAPMFGAAMLAGMQAGSPVGTPLTHKFINALSLEQDSSWNPKEDGEEMIKAGLVFAEVVDGVGRRVVRNVTTHLTTSNIAYTEASCVEATNYAVYNLRTTMERMVGKAGFAGTAEAAKGLAVNQLGLLVGVAIVAYRSLQLSLILDVIECAVEMAPVLPVNFVQTTVHLVSVPQQATAA